MYESRIAISSINKIPLDFMREFYFNGSYRLYYKHSCVYAIPENEYKRLMSSVNGY